MVIFFALLAFGHLLGFVGVLIYSAAFSAVGVMAYCRRRSLPGKRSVPGRLKQLPLAIRRRRLQFELLPGTQRPTTPPWQS